MEPKNLSIRNSLFVLFLLSITTPILAGSAGKVFGIIPPCGSPGNKDTHVTQPPSSFAIYVHITFKASISDNQSQSDYFFRITEDSMHPVCDTDIKNLLRKGKLTPSKATPPLPFVDPFNRIGHIHAEYAGKHFLLGGRSNTTPGMNYFYEDLIDDAAATISDIIPRTMKIPQFIDPKYFQLGSKLFIGFQRYVDYYRPLYGSLNDFDTTPRDAPRRAKITTRDIPQFIVVDLTTSTSQKLPRLPEYMDPYISNGILLKPYIEKFLVFESL